MRKIFKCVYCESEFSFKNNLKAHIKRNHEENVENIDIEKISAVDKVQKSEKLQLHEHKSTDDKENTRQVHKDVVTWPFLIILKSQLLIYLF